MIRKKDKMNEFTVKEDIIEVGRRMYNRQFVASNDGNISVKLSENEILITATGISKGFMTPDDIIKVDRKGNVISGSKKPSSEIKMHLAAYENRPDVLSVCHAHPQKATAFAVARKVCQEVALPEVIFSIGSVALADYATPSTQQIPDSIKDIVKGTDAILLSNHGALTVGKDVFDAYFKMETLEHFAGIILYARQLGGEQGLSREEISDLVRVRREVFGKADLGYLGDGYCGGRANSEAQNTEEDLQELIGIITNAVIEELKKNG
jgi:L-fuculose-phosphate aldolase